MSWPGEPDVVVAIREALERSKVVALVVLGGSRARGTATGLSDWDLYLGGEPADLMAEIPALVASLQPLAAFWEPLSEQAGYMIVMDGAPSWASRPPANRSRSAASPSTGSKTARSPNTGNVVDILDFCQQTGALPNQAP